MLTFWPLMDAAVTLVLATGAVTFLVETFVVLAMVRIPFRGVGSRRALRSFVVIKDATGIVDRPANRAALEALVAANTITRDEYYQMLQIINEQAKQAEEAAKYRSKQ